MLDDPLPGSDAADEDKTPPPIVIDRYYFKEDETGYLDSRRMHLYLARRGERQYRRVLTDGRFSERFPSWSPDGTQLAFLSKRAPDPDRDNMWGLYVMSAQPGAAARLVTPFVGDSGDSGWMSSPAMEPERPGHRLHRRHRAQAPLLRADEAECRLSGRRHSAHRERGVGSQRAPA